MRTLARTTALFALAAAAGLSCGDDEEGRSLQWEWGFGPAVGGERATFVRARILEGGCGGRAIYEEQIRTGVPPGGMLPPELAAGTYGFSVEARDASCVTFAAGCTEARVPDQRSVTVVVAAATESSACLPADCNDGRCPGPDASVCMPGTEVCNDADDDCDARVDEVFDLDTDLANCGACGNACMLPNATTECAGGTCTGAIVECDDGFDDCDAMGATGCETDLRTLADCGACGTACGPFANATATCADGTCSLDACDEGFEDCDADPMTGCETDIRTLTDCGACGTVCARTNATATCATGTCMIETCNAGFGDCDGLMANGCEVDVTSANRDCGTCGNRCAGSQVCCAGMCETSCPGGVCCVL